MFHIIKDDIMNFKKILPDICIKTCVFGLLILSSCDKGFEEMNKDPNAYTEPVITSLFSSTVLRAAGVSAPQVNNKQTGMFVQFYSSLNAAQWTGDKYLFSNNYNNRLWEVTYPETMKDVVDIIDLTKGKPDMLNQYNIARILRVYVIHRVTDIYGDVPYSEAGLGAISAIYKPKYDRQSAIYADMLKELDEATKALDPAKPSYGGPDFVYSGSPAKWKAFGYSMMLRLGMRLTKVDIALAESWVKKAIAGGVMQSNADLARMVHTSGSGTNWNWSSNQIQTAEGVPPSAQGRGFLKMAKTFIDHLKVTSDPRLPFFATLWQGNINIANLPANSNPANQKGLPQGYDNTTINTLFPTWTADMAREFSEPNIHTYAHLAAPTIFQSYAEVEFLLAEASLRGWGPGTAKEHYDKGVRASIESTTLFPNAALAIPNPTTASSAYLAANPYRGGTFAQQMEQIHTQFWVSVFPNNIEVYSNWRRTGFPILIPNNYPGNETGGVIPRRLKYPVVETSINTANYNAAVAIQGPDIYLTRVWWDKL